MLNKLLIFALLISFLNVHISENISAQSTGGAAAYMSMIGEQYKDIQKEMWDYTSSFAHSRNARKVERKRKDLLKTIYNARKKVRTMKSFDKDYSLRDSVVAYLKLTFDVLNEDFAKIINMEEVAEQSYDAMEAYILAKQKANEKLDDATQRMSNQYNAFAARYGVHMVEQNDDISQKLKKSSEALNYYNKVYLVFFKAYKQEIYLMDALGKADINAIEQNRNALISVSDEGLEKLNEIKHFKGDNSINMACHRMLDFYKDESENNIPQLADFTIKAQEFKEMSELFESKDRMLLTQDEVDKYNEGVKNYNSGIKDYNNTNNKLDTKRNNVLESWNNSVTNFMGRHVPKR